MIACIQRHSNQFGRITNLLHAQVCIKSRTEQRTCQRNSHKSDIFVTIMWVHHRTYFHNEMIHSLTVKKSYACWEKGRCALIRKKVRGTNHHSHTKFSSSSCQWDFTVPCIEIQILQPWTKRKSRVFWHVWPMQYCWRGMRSQISMSDVGGCTKTMIDQQRKAANTLTLPP